MRQSRQNIDKENRQDVSQGSNSWESKPSPFSAQQIQQCSIQGKSARFVCQPCTLSGPSRVLKRGKEGGKTYPLFACSSDIADTITKEMGLIGGLAGTGCARTPGRVDH
eukprot:scaffold55746_cov17-Tisochrysis_lutea.AAC.1